MAIGQGIFLLLFLILKRYKNIPYIFLSLILVALLFELIHGEMVNSRIILKVPYLVSTGHFFSYCIGPLIYLYIFTIAKEKFALKWHHFIHFLPFLIYNIIKLPKYLQSSSQKASFLNYYYNRIDSNLDFFVNSRGFVDVLKGFLLFDLHKIIYVIIAFIIFFNYKRKLLNQYSNIGETNIKWMQNILYGYLLIWLIIPVQRFSGFFDISSSTVYNIESFLLSLHIYFITYMVFSQQLSSKLISIPKSTLNKKLLDDIMMNSDRIMNDDELFLKPNLTLSFLANTLNIRGHNLSKAINHNLKISFYDYVNRYRVEKSKQLLTSKKNNIYTVEHIGEISGFSSKTTFYRAFKKYTGITPKKFQNK